MTADEFQARLRERLGAQIVALTAPAPRRLFLTVAPGDLVAACRLARDELGFRHLSTVTGRDTGSAIEVLYHLSQTGMVLTVKTALDRAAPAVPTVTGLYPGAVLYEREVYDLLGVRVEGHPDPRRLVLPDDWPEGVHPLRKDWQPPTAAGAQP
jgi:NADH:ubiquinone oxidoreductase subunit C